MEKFNIVNKKLQKLVSLKRLLQQGLEIIPDLKVYLDKIDSIADSIKDGEISVVLIGSFADGKTTAIAGLLGRLEDNMKIDNDESTDELTVYRPKDLKKGFKIVDTPGLFGTKEKEIDGKNVQFSKITENFISEAHIIIYVCDAVTPLKESHVEIIRRVMRTYKKLDNTIFVINKMDEAGYDLLDKYDFNNGCIIKKENLVSRLRSTINLTPDEEKCLHIVCIAADPKGKGLNHWFTKIENYYERSHIKDLRDCVNEVVNSSDCIQIANSTIITSIEDLLRGLQIVIAQAQKPLTKVLKKIKDVSLELKEDQKQLKHELTLAKKELQTSINNTKDDALNEIRGASLETIGDVISSQLGEQDGKVDFYVFLNKINSLLDECCETNCSNIKATCVTFERTSEKQETMLNDAVKLGIDGLKNFNINGEQIKAIRNIVNESYKFKPWGAINLGKNITKWASRAGAGLSVAMEVYGWYKNHEEAKKLAELKETLCGAINNIIAKVFKSFENDEDYYKKYAPSYLELCNKIEERNKEIEALEQKAMQLEIYKNQIEIWKNSAEYVEFEQL